MLEGVRIRVGLVVGPKLNTQTGSASSHQASTSAGLSGRRLFWARIGWLVIFVLNMGLFFASIPPTYDWYTSFASLELDPATARANLEAAGISVASYARYELALAATSAMVCSVVSVIIFWRRSDDWMALLTSLGLLAFGIHFLTDGPTALVQHYPAVWLPVNLLAFLGSMSFVLFLFLFPDGRFVPRWTRWIPILWAVHEVVYYLFPDSIFNIGNTLPLLEFLVSTAFFCTGVAAQIYRYRRASGPAQRQQTKWVVFGTVAALLGALAFNLPLNFSPALRNFESPYALAFEAAVAGFMCLIPLSIGVAILRHRLWDIDAIINRTLVYGALTASVVAIYALIVGSLGSLVQVRGDFLGSFLVSLLAAGFVAVLFAPLREGLQRGVNRLMYGERDDPYRVLSRLGRRLEGALEPKAVLPTIVDTVAGALKLPYAAIAMRQEDGYEVAAAHGTPTGEETALPLNYAGATVGRLILAPRAPGEPFAPADRRLLEDLARQAEVAVQAVRLNADLQRSRERLVSTREEERRRLRRDLHDGLAPTLASLSLGLDVSTRMLENEPREAEALLREMKSQAQGAVVDIRRLVYGLRPPALDDLGLVAAIREQASKYDRLADDPARRVGAGSENELTFSVEAPDKLPPLPAAVEVACYRIVQEAINNVVRHAEARTCRVRLSIDDASNELELEVADDGVGLPEDRRAGVGTSSMAERAAELGGTCVVAPNPTKGTRVVARLPLFDEQEE
jgi:signal transduction histidine kinase